ncbi:MAG: hypothetical protein HY268_05090 [Deltaproteobacteria bacterium]|nr:hypothetical protein [Deltaproteobacteria bacterium]
MEEPRTQQDWQDAVDAAQGALALDAARQYGWVTGGPEVYVARCEDILRRGKSRGVLPTPDAIERFANGLLLTSKTLLF